MAYQTPIIQTDIAPCCGKDPKGVYFNQYNLVVQCHNCGHVYEPKPTDKGEFEAFAVAEAEATA